MGDNRNRVDETTLAYIRKLLNEGKSATEIGQKLSPTRSRNAVLGIIDRHIKPVPRRAKTHEPKTNRISPPRDPRAGSHVFVSPSAPRRFSFQDLEG